jgi:hypothetical protein
MYIQPGLTFSQPMLRGSVIKDPRDWMRGEYGEAAYQSGLKSLSQEHRRIIDGQILASSWYPLAAWDSFNTQLRVEAKRLKGESELDFDLRVVRESGSRIAKTTYKFILALMSPQTLVSRIPTLYRRFHSHGLFELVSNEPGKFVIRCADGHEEMRENLVHYFSTGVLLALELGRVPNPQVAITRNEIDHHGLQFEVTGTYRA